MVQALLSFAYEVNPPPLVCVRAARTRSQNFAPKQLFSKYSVYFLITTAVVYLRGEVFLVIWLKLLYLHRASWVFTLP